jgi:hypothetical protein
MRWGGWLAGRLVGVGVWVDTCQLQATGASAVPLSYKASGALQVAPCFRSGCRLYAARICGHLATMLTGVVVDFGCVCAGCGSCVECVRRG